MTDFLNTFSNLIYPVLDLTAIVIIIASIYFVSRQKKSQYPDAKNLLLIVYLFFVCLMVLETLRSFISTDEFMTLYAVGGTSFVLLDVIFLTVLGVLVYLKPAMGTFKDRLQAVFTSLPHGPILGAFIAFIAYSEFTLATTPKEIAIVEIPNAFGALSPLKTAELGQEWLFQALIVLAVFIAYSTTLFVLAAKRTSNVTARRALYIVPISWIVIGAELITFNGFLVSQGYDYIGFGYLIVAMAFALTAYSFRDTSTVASFFGGIDRQLIPVSNRFSAMLENYDISKANTLLFEVEPSANFEKVVEDFSVEQISKRVPVFLFSSKGSPLYKRLSPVEGIRFYSFSSNLSFPKPTSNPLEILVPENDQAVLLDVLNTTITSPSDGKVAIVYNNLSDAILTWGVEGTYKFVKKALEVLSTPNVISIFLITSGAHDERTMNLIRNLFLGILYYGKDGIKVVKPI
jgi:hypothetical protein